VNDIAIVQSLGSGNWRFVSYTKASGLPVVSPNGPFSDSVGITKNSSDATKIWQTRADNITTANTRTAWIADEDSTIGNSWLSPNLSVTVSAAANAMTITWTDRAGSAFSTTNPLISKFRSATATSGGYSNVSTTAALSITIASGSTVGTVSGQASRIYFGRANNSGTVVPWFYNPISGVQHAPCRSQFLVNTLLNSSANSAPFFYSSSALSSVPIIVDGYFESTQTTAGTWASAPTYVHLFRPGDFQSGDIVQYTRTSDGAVSSTAATTSYNDTIPQITAGSQILSLSHVPRSACNLLKIDVQACWDTASSDDVTLHLHNGGANALVAASTSSNAASSGRTLELNYAYVANTASSISFTARIGSNAASGLTINGRATLRKLGGVSNTYMDVHEVFV
jgi:hypothetical protein